MALLLFDLVLCALLLLLAGAAMLSRSLTQAVTLFIAFGVMMALAWARLKAPDLALAEAAIGAGLTGALCFTALARYAKQPAYPQPALWRPLTFIGLVSALLLASLSQIPLQPSSAIPALVQQHLPQSGVSHPVTAVLLNFRAWDTLLELLVLLLALLGARQAPADLPRYRGWSLSISWSRLLSPLLLLVSGYLLWRGAAAPGGAFQAGALLASGLVILRLNQQLSWLSWRHFWVRALVLGGLLAFVLAGVFSLLLQGLGAVWLSWPQSIAGAVILIVESFATLAIAVTLTLLVVGEPKPEVADA